MAGLGLLSARPEASNLPGQIVTLARHFDLIAEVGALGCGENFFGPSLGRVAQLLSTKSIANRPRMPKIGSRAPTIM